MINFRFYLVSIVAVFLALAVGVVMGYGVLGQPTVKGLQSRIDTIGAKAEEQRVVNDLLSSELDSANSGVQSAVPFAATQRLASTRVAVIAARGVDENAVDRIVKDFGTSGVSGLDLVWLEESWRFKSEKSQSTAIRLLGLESGANKAEITQAANTALAERLVFGLSITGSDLLNKLIDSGFVSLGGVGGSTPKPSEVGGSQAQLALLVQPGHADEVKYFAQAAINKQILLAVAEVFINSSENVERSSSVTAILGNEEFKNKISTIDNAETEIGALAVVLALGDLKNGVVNHLGVGEGSQRLLPVWWRL
jgi:hypothetical protein